MDRMYQKLSGREPADGLLEKAKKTIENNGLNPKLGIVVVGDYKPSQIYVRNKEKKAASIGVKTEIFSRDPDISQKEILDLVEQLNNDDSIDGFIVQTPLPKQIDTNKVFEVINPKKDVDGFHPQNMGKVLLNIFDDEMFPPATPSGVMYLLDYYKVQIPGKNAVVVGRSNIVGKPVAMMLLHRHATVTICHSKTAELADYTKKADIIVAAAGSPFLIKADMVKKGAHIVDVGTTRITIKGEEKVVGDVDFENVIKKAHCSPVPGGVGPLTVAMLINNTVKAALR